MRVTQQSISTQVLDGLQQAFRRVARAQESVTTGLRINRLSDDPIGAARALGLRSFEASLSQFDRNVNNTIPFLEQTDSVLADVVQGLTRAKELALSMVNATNTILERQQVAKEIDQIFLQMLSLANTQVDNRYLFGGFLNGIPPFLQGAGAVNYRGDNGEIFIQTSASGSLPINILGNKIFQGAAVVGGVGVFDALLDLKKLLLGGSGDPNSLTLAVNLDANTAVGGGFTPPDAVGTETTPGTFLGEADFSTTVSVFDSLGDKHVVTFLFAKTGATTFKYRVVADSQDITGGTPGNYYQIAPEGTLEFNPDGTFNAGASTLTDITLIGFANGADDITINAADLSFAGSTQLAQSSAVFNLVQSNPNGFNTQIGRLDAAIDQILTFRAEVGARLNSGYAARDALDVLKIHTQAQRSNIEDADILAVYSDFARFQQAFEAALQSASQVLRPSLLDFIR